MSEPAIINAVGVYKGQIENGVLYYHAIGEDAEGDQVVFLFGCQPNFSETVDKALSKLFPVRFKTVDPVKVSVAEPEETLLFATVDGKVIVKCYQECPYFYLDGGPGPIMACNHPETKANFAMTQNLADIYIISHPQCDTGFPVRCPLRKENNTINISPTKGDSPDATRG
jgi:hypothetical protein